MSIANDLLRFGCDLNRIRLAEITGEPIMDVTDGERMAIDEHKTYPPVVREIAIGDDEIDELILSGELVRVECVKRMLLENQDWCSVDEFQEFACLSFLRGSPTAMEELTPGQAKKWRDLKDALRTRVEEIIREERVRRE